MRDSPVTGDVCVCVTAVKLQRGLFTGNKAVMVIESERDDQLWQKDKKIREGRAFSRVVWRLSPTRVVSEIFSPK